MHLHAYLTLLVLPWAAASYGPRDAKFCSLVNKAVTVFREQRQATSYCSSYLKISTVYRTTTVTSTASVTSQSVVTSTATATPRVTVTAQALNTITSAATFDTTVSAAVSTTSVVATSTVYTSTFTQVDTTTVTTQSTSTSTSSTTTNLSSCTAPVFLKKRQLGRGKPVPPPKCLSNYYQPSVISRACSCLAIPQPTSTQTSTVFTTKTITSLTTTSATQTASPVTVTVTTTRDVTQVSSVFRTQTTITTVIVSATLTTSLVTTTTSTTTTVSTQTVVATATARRFTNFALLGSYNSQYGVIQDSVGGSGQGVYFKNSDLGSAATFSFSGNQLFYNNQYMQTYAASSGNYYVVVERPYAQFGYPTTCTLNPPAFSGDGCSLECQIPGGFYIPASGNDVDNYNGAWGFQGSVDRFIVYAVGQT